LVEYGLISLIYNVLKDLCRWILGRSKKLPPEEVARLRQRWKDEVERRIRWTGNPGGYGEAIIRDVKRIDLYPEVDGKKKGISPWFKVALLGTYHRGLQVGLRIVGLKYEEHEKAWRFCNYIHREKPDINAYVVGLIPFERIVSVDWEGDEYDHIPHLYCHFSSRKKEPYEVIIICEKRNLDNYEYYSEIAKYDEVRKLSKKKGSDVY
jgi:hypothetical protein